MACWKLLPVRLAVICVSILCLSVTASSFSIRRGPARSLQNSRSHDVPLVVGTGHRPQHGLQFALSVRRGGSTQLQSTALATLDTLWKANPLIAAAVVCATKGGLADLVAQKTQAQPDAKFDRLRSLSFVCYGALYQGMAQELIYNNLYSYLFGTATTPRVVVKKVLFDAFFHNALVCIPMAYAVKALVFKYSIWTGIRHYVDDVRQKGLLLKYYALWMPVNTMIFTIIPPHWRITVMAVVSFFWIIILSKVSSRARD